MYRLKQENEVDKQLLKNKHKKKYIIFIEKYKYKNVVYIIQLEDENYEKNKNIN